MFATRTEAFQVAVFMLNRKPFHKLDNLMPDYSWLRSFGCICFPHVDSSMRNKFAPKALSMHEQNGVIQPYGNRVKQVQSCLSEKLKVRVVTRTKSLEWKERTNGRGALEGADMSGIEATSPVQRVPTPGKVFCQGRKPAQRRKLQGIVDKNYSWRPKTSVCGQFFQSGSERRVEP